MQVERFSVHRCGPENPAERTVEYRILKGSGMDSIRIILDRIYRIDRIFFACGESTFGRRPLDPDHPVNPVHLLFKNKNPFLF
jgi:hypothetical protein